MKYGNVGNLIKEGKIKEAVKAMKELFSELLEDKLKRKGIKCKDMDFGELIELCIANFPEDYDTLVYLNNLFFFTEEEALDSLYTLASIYDNMSAELG